MQSYSTNIMHFILCFFHIQLRDIGRKYRQYHEAGKKELEEAKAEIVELNKKLEDARTVTAEASLVPPTISEENDKSKVP